MDGSNCTSSAAALGLSGGTAAGDGRPATRKLLPLDRADLGPQSPQVKRTLKGREGRATGRPSMANASSECRTRGTKGSWLRLDFASVLPNRVVNMRGRRQWQVDSVHLGFRSGGGRREDGMWGSPGEFRTTLWASTTNSFPLRGGAYAPLPSSRLMKSVRTDHGPGWDDSFPAVPVSTAQHGVSVHRSPRTLLNTLPQTGICRERSAEDPRACRSPLYPGPCLHASCKDSSFRQSIRSPGCTERGRVLGAHGMIVQSQSTEGTCGPPRCRQVRGSGPCWTPQSDFVLACGWDNLKRISQSGEGNGSTKLKRRAAGGRPAG
jgi:hypothetical protein